MAQSETSENLQNQALDPKPVINRGYNPNKRNRLIRRVVYQRYYWLKGETSRVEAEADWDMADKEYNMWVEIPDPDNWHADLHLPDAFAAIQTQMQETIERKTRPHLSSTEESDEPLAEFGNASLTYNMNSTGFDYQYFMAKLAAAARGTSFLMNYWRTDKRTVKDPVSVKDGVIQYQDKEIIDFDDDYTEWVPNEFIYIDEKAKHIDEAVDMIKREILNIDEFHRIYDNKPGFFDTDYVYAGGDRSNRSFFRLPQDITAQDVELLHYYNRSTDSYWCVANNVTIYDSPLPWKHKELPVAVLYQYRVYGRFWGMGIPKIMHFLSEERRTIRNLNMDRQKIIIGGAFVHNSSFDIDDEDTTLYPGRIMSIDTGGQPVGNAIQQLGMGEVPASYFRTEEILLQDTQRATGIDDRVESANAGGTATEAAILKESTLKRINLISITAEMDCVVRIGKLKWSNIQFFYGTPRLETIFNEDGEDDEKKSYRKISVQGQKFSIVDDNGTKRLSVDAVRGASALELKPEMAKFLEGSYDISVDTDLFAPVSKAIEQTKKTEMFSLMLSNPATLAVMDINGAVEDVLKVNNIKPDKWMKNPDGSKKDMMMLADAENDVMAAGQPLSGTEGATEDHTLVHLIFTKTQQYQSLPPPNQQLIMDHILQEHDANPATGSSADLLGQYGLGAPAGSGQPGAAPSPGAGVPVPTGLSPQTTQPQSQVADIQPTNFAVPE